MTLIKSISGIRGTIGGKKNKNLTPNDVVDCTAGFAQWVIDTGANKKVVVGMDGRITGPIVSALAIQTLVSMGIDVIDLGHSTTPTVEMAVPEEKAGAGIIFTASHNPKEWNALKFLNSKGEFISASDGEEILGHISSGAIEFASVEHLGSIQKKDGYINFHINKILTLPYVDAELVSNRKFHIVVDCINSTGAISIPPLLDKLGCTYTLINAEITGEFAHNPEPLAKHLTELSKTVVSENAHLGISVDPDVDRLAFVNEDGSMFGEEYTLVAIADFICSRKSGNTVSNLSSTRALADVTKCHSGVYYASAVGEVNVVNMMKKVNAVIGGEGNGGVIVPELHYGRDALAGIAIFLTHLAEQNMNMTKLKACYPHYEMVKDKINLTPEIDVEDLLKKMKLKYEDENINTIDGLKIDFEEGWVHLRKSNTELIIRIYSEANSSSRAEQLVDMIKSDINGII